MHQAEDLTALFHLSLSEQAYVQFQDFENFVQDLVLNEDTAQWQFPAGSAQYKVSKAYRLLIITPKVQLVIRRLWQTCCQLKHKNFFWLVANNRLNSKALLQRKIFYTGLYVYTCALCNLQVLETRGRLFFFFAHLHNYVDHTSILHGHLPDWAYKRRLIIYSSC